MQVCSLLWQEYSSRNIEYGENVPRISRLVLGILMEYTNRKIVELQGMEALLLLFQGYSITWEFWGVKGKDETMDWCGYRPMCSCLAGSLFLVVLWKKSRWDDGVFRAAASCNSRRINMYGLFWKHITNILCISITTVIYISDVPRIFLKHWELKYPCNMLCSLGPLVRNQPWRENVYQIWLIIEKSSLI